MTWFVVDGMDGSGKSTVGHLIEEKRLAEGKRVLFLEHPNDSCRSGRLAHKYLLKDGKFAMILTLLGSNGNMRNRALVDRRDSLGLALGICAKHPDAFSARNPRPPTNGPP